MAHNYRFRPKPGWRAFVEDKLLLQVYDGVGWVGATPSVLQNLALLGSGATAYAADPLSVNPLSAKLNAALRGAKTVADGGAGDLFYTMSKEVAGHDHGLTLRTAHVAKALTGPFGSGRFPRRGLQRWQQLL